MRAAGLKVGNLRMRLFRPFPFDLVRRVLPKAKKIAVVDRNISYGHHGIFAQEVKSALLGHAAVPVFGFIAGLGGRDITPATFREIVDHAAAHDAAEDNIVWIGVKK
jgi:pyruvate/2-oxoacid:ferredoxin oxidoreductase alpha subunit